MSYSEYLRIGFIQTVVEGDVAWRKLPNGKFEKRMSRTSEINVIEEIKKGFVEFSSYSDYPNIIILPELSVPLGFEYELRRLCAASGAVVIAGLDFVWNKGKAANKAIVCVPKNWPSKGKSYSTSFFYFGKTYFSRYEEEMYPGSLESEPAMYILDAGDFGKIGVAICSDFFDIERYVVYKGRIHHMLIIAHNPDTESYYFLTEAISRLVFCNVVICNTGEYGDSIAFSPKRKAYERTLYRHKGKGLFSTQMVKLPVASLDSEQQPTAKSKLFKSKPPGYKKK
ncbi:MULTISPECIES: hypothetical protein [Flavobacteriaceae]|uniref:hypothetical protein n=1 Tax=Flavobacteriaceae TaxID=49546 RepID=UPI002349F202|nr:hypothetical protein [Muricauda sp. SP22]MDC6362147.1 hypothetical protein [Muricauda sp. SP22]